MELENINLNAVMKQKEAVFNGKGFLITLFIYLFIYFCVTEVQSNVAVLGFEFRALSLPGRNSTEPCF
jgi:hypothetical protein